MSQPDASDAWVDIGSVADFNEGQAQTIHIGRRAIAIVRHRGRFFAIHGLCPHQLGPLSDGLVRLKLQAAARSNELEIDEETAVITCPWHGWEFDVQTGRMIADKSRRVRTYDVRVSGPRVLLNTRGSRGK